VIEKAGFESVDLEALYARSDYITVHVPKMKETTGLIGKAAFDRMKDGVMVINCARGGIVAESDLYDALSSGKVAGAALDVFAVEPPGENRLFGLDSVICTPHLGASTAEAQTNVATAVADQIIQYLQSGTVINAVNTPSVTGELLEQLGPLLAIADQMGTLQAQLTSGPLKEVVIEYAGDFKGLDLAPVTTVALKGLLTPKIRDDVNFVNAPVIAKERGIKMTETTSTETEDYLSLITLKVVTSEMTSTVAGTIFGKRDSRVVKINNFRLEMVPCGHMALIYNINKPGAIGSIGKTLGDHDINIGQMQVGEEETGDLNVVFLSTDTPIPDSVVAELEALPMIKSVMPLEFQMQNPEYLPSSCAT